MRRPRLLLPFLLGAALCIGGQVDAATHGEAGAVSSRPAATPEAVAVEGAPPAAPYAPAGPSTFALGVGTLVGLGILRWRRRRFLAEHAAPLTARG
jgi:hypothetical protein